jgi:glioma pathogenesis-related protein 2
MHIQERTNMTTPFPINAPKLVACINTIRASFGAPPVQWDPKIARFAQDWANRGMFKHRPYNVYGENLAITTSKRSDMSDAIAMFEGESTNYDWNNPGFSSNTGHFTALVWCASRRIGAGAATLKDGRNLFVLNFDPPGNIINRNMQLFRTNVLPRVKKLETVKED